MEWTDQAAAEEACRGNQQAFRVLVERHSRAVFRLAFRMTGNEQDAEDLVQETFLRAWKQLHRFDGRAAFGSWLYRIAANCSLDLIRAKRSRRETQPAADEANAANWMEAVASADPTPERLTHSSQIAALLPAAMQQLSAAERAAFVLRHYEGRNIEEIAQALGTGTGAAKHSVFRAVQKLRRALEPVWETGK
ncbi:MAG TPA: sigma-70 family RNA polymerase sigma factor [Bryobacteraceae bacterium]|jgi:RNA polymerase sigma-70 factor (ECF subfamily)|nr:sigma-70 family RNA polymerase sigma factor [Bryobacteraceae bacterium]